MRQRSNARSDRSQQLDGGAEALRELSGAYSPDALPDQSGRAGTTHLWLYRADDFAAAALRRTVRDGYAANRFVHYPGNYARPAARVQFRATAARTVTFQVRVFGRVLDSDNAEEQNPPARTVTLRPGAAVEIAVGAVAGDAAAVCVTGDSATVTWHARQVGSDDWEHVDPRPAGEMAPHLADPDTVTLTPSFNGDVYSLTAPVLGRPVIATTDEPVLTTGESVNEALGDASAAESRFDVEQVAPGLWRSVHALGFQHLVVRSTSAVTDVRVEADYWPVHRRGAFVCSDLTLNEIWSVSAYTLRLCTQTVIVDGIKRDRMPWAGDLSLSALSTSFAGGGTRAIRDTLSALGHPTHGYVNGIADYSLWWLITADLYLTYFGDDDWAQRHSNHIARFAADLLEHTDADGLFRPTGQSDGFKDTNAGSIFIDWGVQVDADRTSTALQMLWYWALRSTANIVDRSAGDSHAWHSRAEHTKKTLHARAWHSETGRWAEYIDGEAGRDPRATAFGVLTGLTPTTHLDHAADILALAHTGTPFMMSFALRALAIAGGREQVVALLRSRWETMLTAGARTFWEEFPQPNSDPLEMYGRPFGKSLCHGWSAGPAALLPETILGLTPLEDGWRRFSVRPVLGDLEWAAAVVPTEVGDIVVRAEQGATRVEIPSGASLVTDDGVITGPRTVVVPATLISV